jgi:hypothetical protein
MYPVGEFEGKTALRPVTASAAHLVSSGLLSQLPNGIPSLAPLTPLGGVRHGRRYPLGASIGPQVAPAPL